MKYGFFYLSLLTMFIQSFVITNAIKGLILPTIFILLQFLFDIILMKKNALKILLFLIPLFLLFFSIQCTSQIFNIIYNVNIKEVSSSLTISSELSNKTFFRASLITQSIYLFVSIIFFLYTMIFLQEKGKIEIFKFLKISIFIYISYGFIEFIGFILTGENFDFISNRITGESYQYGFFQTISLGGLTLQRMKSLAGEPSMFSFSILTFLIVFYYKQDNIYLLCLVALLLSTSTTGILGLLIFILLDLIFFRKTIKLSILLGAISSLILFTNFYFISNLYNFTINKLFTTDNISSIERIDSYTNIMSIFINSDPIHMLIGYGFGFFRSTDGFSTLLANTGILGLIMYLLFFIYPIVKLDYKSDYNKGLAISMIVTIISVMTSVSEFFYYNIWFLSALIWHEYSNSLEKIENVK